MKMHFGAEEAARSSYGWYTSLQGPHVELVKNMMAQRSFAASRRGLSWLKVVMLWTLPVLASAGIAWPCAVEPPYGWIGADVAGFGTAC